MARYFSVNELAPVATQTVVVVVVIVVVVVKIGFRPPELLSGRGGEGKGERVAMKQVQMQQPDFSRTLLRKDRVTINLLFARLLPVSPEKKSS